MFGPVNRFEPAGPAGAYKTYSVRKPLATHWRPATCAEMCERADRLRAAGQADDGDAADCEPYRHGWATPAVDDDTVAFLRRLCQGLEDGHRRAFVEQAEETSGRRLFVFEPGTTCFRVSQHVVPLDRPELYVVRDGDHRGNPLRTQPFVHSTADAWVDDFGTHQDRLRRTIEGG